MREEVEHLKAGGIGEICVIGMCGKGEIGVGGVFVG